MSCKGAWESCTIEAKLPNGDRFDLCIHMNGRLDISIEPEHDLDVLVIRSFFQSQRTRPITASNERALLAQILRLALNGKGRVFVQGILKDEIEQALKI